MGKYIRIKKSKNLRFRLISILYLLFISLSIIQIPIGWLRVNPNLRLSLLSLDSKIEDKNNIHKIKGEVAALDREFLAFAGMDSRTEELLSPENYAQTDQFFLEMKKGEVLFEQLQSLNDSMQSLPEDNKARIKFKDLFAMDLEHGLEARTPQVWSQWKFAHVPATVVRLQMADLMLKLNLLQGDFEIDPQSHANRPELIMAYNIDRLHIGDTAFFVYEGKKRPQLDLAVGQEKPQSYEWEKDTLVFVALDTGQYSLQFTLGKENRSFEFDVLPANFKNLEYRAPEAFYSGIPLALPITSNQADLDFSCSCMPGQKLRSQQEKLSITPLRAGWCYIRGIDSEFGNLAFQDSIYIQALPAPMLYVQGVSGEKISQRRLKQMQGLDLKIILPGQDPDQLFSIKTIHAQLYGNFGVKSIETEGRLALTPEDIEGLSYIEINSVSLNGPDGEILISDRQIINVTNHES